LLDVVGQIVDRIYHAEQHVRRARRRQWIILPRANLSPGSLRCLRCSAHVHPRPIEALQRGHIGISPLESLTNPRGEEVTVRDPTHPLFGRTFRIIRRSVHRGGGFPVSYEVEYRNGASLLVPVAATEPLERMENRTKLSLEALHDLTSLVEQLEHHADRSEGPLGRATNGTAAPNRRRGRRSAGGGEP
jgi:hypothetical protein